MPSLFADLCDELAAVHHLAVNSPARPSTWRHTKENRRAGSWSEPSKPYVHYLFHPSKHLLWILFFHPATEVRIHMWHQTVGPPFIVQSNRHLPFSFHLIWRSTSASRLWFALISRWTSLRQRDGWRLTNVGFQSSSTVPHARLILSVLIKHRSC